MKMIVAATVLALAAISQGKIMTQTVEYKQGDVVLEGYLAYDDSIQEKRPGVLVVHEWYGLNDYARKRTEQLAGLGFVAFAADIYGKGVRPSTTQEAGAQATKYRSDRALLRARAAAALEVLRKDPHVDPARTAAIGYCFGGGTVLELARSGADLSAVVSFHGNLDTPNPADARNIKAKVLVLTGADDKSVPAAQREAFVEEMRAAHVDWQMTLYGNAVHGFTNAANGSDPTRGVAYNADADRRSWQAMLDFFGETLGWPK